MRDVYLQDVLMLHWLVLWLKLQHWKLNTVFRDSILFIKSKELLNNQIITKIETPLCKKTTRTETLKMSGFPTPHFPSFSLSFPNSCLDLLFTEASCLYKWILKVMFSTLLKTCCPGWYVHILYLTMFLPVGRIDRLPYLPKSKTIEKRFVGYLSSGGHQGLVNCDMS